MSEAYSGENRVDTKKVQERLAAGIKKYQSILASAKARDVGEADTVAIIRDMLTEVFGYDNYPEFTSEFAIRDTYRWRSTNAYRSQSHRSRLEGGACKAGYRQRGVSGRRLGIADEWG